MAITYSNKIGATRKKLARLLEQAFPGYAFDPANLQAQNPSLIRWSGCCVWSGHGRRRDPSRKDLLDVLEVTSWSRMRDCARSGIEFGGYIEGDRTTQEIYAKAKV